MKTAVVLISTAIVSACAVVDTVRTGVQEDIAGLHQEFVRVFNRKEN